MTAAFEQADAQYRSTVLTAFRNVADTLKQGTMNSHVRLAIKMGAPAEAAYAMASLNPAKHAHMESIVGSIAPGRYADVVLLSSVKDVAIKYVFANGQLAAKDGKYLLNPTAKDLVDSGLHLVVAGTQAAVLMVESEARGLSEEIMLGAVVFGHEQMQLAIRTIKEIVAEAGKPVGSPRSVTDPSLAILSKSPWFGLPAMP